MEKIRMNVQGHVQGVGFRYMTKMVADELHITGTVQNEDDGSVAIEAVGEENAIKLFVQRVKDSPSPMGRVTYVDIQKAPFLEDFSQFRITN